MLLFTFILTQFLLISALSTTVVSEKNQYTLVNLVMINPANCKWQLMQVLIRMCN